MTTTKPAWNKGPWYVRQNDGAYVNEPGHAQIRIEESGPHEMVVALVVSDTGLLNHEANAALIATSPDMYETISALIERHDSEAHKSSFRQCGCRDCAPFRVVLARARGEQP